MSGAPEAIHRVADRKPPQVPSTGSRDGSMGPLRGTCGGSWSRCPRGHHVGRISGPVSAPTGGHVGVGPLLLLPEVLGKPQRDGATYESTWRCRSPVISRRGITRNKHYVAASATPNTR